MFTSSVCKVIFSVESNQKWQNSTCCFPIQEKVFYYTTKIRNSHTHADAFRRTSHAFVRPDSPPQKQQQSFMEFSFQTVLPTDSNLTYLTEHTHFDELFCCCITFSEHAVIPSFLEVAVLSVNALQWMLHVLNLTHRAHNTLPKYRRVQLLQS